MELAIFHNKTNSFFFFLEECPWTQMNNFIPLGIIKWGNYLRAVKKNK